MLGKREKQEREDSSQDMEKIAKAIQILEIAESKFKISVFNKKGLAILQAHVAEYLKQMKLIDIVDRRVKAHFDEFSNELEIKVDMILNAARTISDVESTINEPNLDIPTLHKILPKSKENELIPPGNKKETQPQKSNWNKIRDSQEELVFKNAKSGHTISIYDDGKGNKMARIDADVSMPFKGEAHLKELMKKYDVKGQT